MSARGTGVRGIRHVVVVGYGMAGARLVDQIRRRDPAGERVSLTVIGAERHQPYNRLLLSNLIDGSLTPDLLRLQRVDWGREHGVDVRWGRCAVSIDRNRSRLLLDDSSTVEYDDLVLATGARPGVPSIEGLRDVDGALASGVFTFRTLDDCERIMAVARPGMAVAVLGGGLLGVEAARSLVDRGCQVTLVHPVNHLMERQLDAGAGRVLARTLRRLGIQVRLGVAARRYGCGDGLDLDDGERLPVDVVVVCAGVKPDTGLAERAAVTVDRGVVVNDELRTSDPRIYAIGDCAQHPGTESGLVQSAWEQSEVLARLLAGVDPGARYRGTLLVTRLKARDVDLAAFGEAQVEVDALDAEVLCVTDPTRGRYAKLVIRQDRVVGAIVLGAPDAAATITQFYDRGIPVPADRLALLLGRALPEAPDGSVGLGEVPASRMVCWCNSVSKGQLVAAWRRGSRSVTELASATRATTGCGSCRDSVRGMAEWLSTSDAGSTVGAPGG